MNDKQTAMTTEEITLFCQQFYQATYIPITHLQFPDDLIISLPHHVQKLDISKKLAQKIYFSDDKHYFLSDAFAFFGFIPITNSENYLVIGPIFSSPVSSNHIATFMNEFNFHFQDREYIENLFQSAPIFSLKQCLNLLSFLEFTLNRNIISFDIVSDNLNQLQQNFNFELSRTISENRDESFVHNSYQFEKALHHALSIGNKTLVLKLFSDSDNITNGIIADTTLRQQKNTFIVSTTLATRSAIEGGLEIEHAYSLSDLYIQECERLETVEEIISLTTLMYLDFTERVSKSQSNQGISAEVFKAMQFIQNNINKTILVEEVASIAGYSYSYFKNIFKSEVGVTISTFIIQTRLDIAKELLAYSDYSLSYISNYLCFSSQSYFQNQFKKYVGITPLKYRKEYSKI